MSDAVVEELLLLLHTIADALDDIAEPHRQAKRKRARLDEVYGQPSMAEQEQREMGIDCPF